MSADRCQECGYYGGEHNANCQRGKTEREQEAATDFHDGCPRCPNCGHHRHAGSCADTRRGGPHHGQVVITIVANVPYEISEESLVTNIETALEGIRVLQPGGHFTEALENVDVRDIEDARTVYRA